MKKLFIILLINSMICSSAYGMDNQQISQLKAELIERQQKIKQQRNKLASVVFTVGAMADIDCQYDSITDALAVANNINNDYEIRVARNKTYTENITIEHPNLTLKGGFNNCTDALNDVSVGSTQVSVIDASGTHLPVVTIQSGNFNVRNFNNIYNFDIGHGTGNITHPSGGVNVINNNIEVNIENSLINNNTGIKGGGVYVQGNDSDLYLKDTFLLLNSATNGGGLYCTQADVFVYGNSGISINNANGTGFDGNGGGIYSTSQCNVVFFSGTTGGVFDFRGVAGNNANYSGGGIYAELSSRLTFWGYFLGGEFGSADQPVNINGNQAEISAGIGGLGGGIYAQDAGTEIFAYATIIKENQSGYQGGGIGLRDGAKFTMSKLNADCWDTIKCNQIVANIANNGAAGLRVEDNSEVSVKNTWIAEHLPSATNNNSNVFFYGDGEMKALFEGSIFTDNGLEDHQFVERLITIVGDGSELTLAHNSFVNNPMKLFSSLLYTLDAPTVRAHANIIKESDNVEVLNTFGRSNPSVVIACLVAHENDSISGDTILVADPMFVDEANQDFHLSPFSMAIDLCNDVIFPSTTKDMDESDRGWDDLLTDNVAGPFDAGADEFYPSRIADLSVTKTLISQMPYYVDDVVEYQIVVTNNGPDNATNITVEDVPSGMMIQSVQSSSCSSLPCIIPTLSNGISETLTVMAQLRSTVGAFDNTVIVSSDDYEADTSNNVDDENNGGVTVNRATDMAVELNVVTSSPYYAHQVINFQASITNNGSNAAENVMIFPDFNNTHLINVSGQPCVTLPCNISNFPAGTTIELFIAVEIDSAGSFGLSLGVSTDTEDTDVNNDSSMVNGLNAGSNGDLSITAEITTAPEFIAGQQIQIDLHLSNNGPDTLNAVMVNQIITTNLTTDVVSGAGCVALPCLGIALANGESQNIRILATINNPGAFSMEYYAFQDNAFDANIINNRSTVMGSAMASSDIDIVASLMTLPDYYNGEQVEVLMLIGNNGPQTSDQIQLNINSSGLLLDSVSGAGCNAENCQLSALDVGQEYAINVIATIDSDVNFTLQATIEHNNTDTDLTNNTTIISADVSIDPDIIFQNSFD